ncbi:peptidase A24 [Sphingomonas sp. Leaf407]|uniref:prepilin peptidase n=1 Tax=unclassified Sphingomonas TaxID=196159 RepID=UPI0006FEAF1B|nr:MULTISPECIES: A24 family peptidase [unclassified Sphingomonas]KQN37619.1 peptidase A24 [Sphingomonas sp. Leaf42]KQT27986.1 peptidase A24 [Sphingomonas sp. Leaf407]
MVSPLFWPILLGLLGGVFGSFIGALAIRWPAGRSVAAGRSACDGCGRTLRPVELVPIVSFLAVRGRCRTCDAAIAPGQFVTEVLGAAIGIVAGLVAPGIDGVAGATCGWLLLASGAIDLAAFWLPDRLTIALALVASLGGLGGIAPDFSDRAIGGLAGFGSLWLVATLYRATRGRTGLGGGDPKLFGAIGLWLGWRALPVVLLVSTVAGLCVVVAMRITGREVKATDRLPLGTLLAIAAFLVWSVGG